MYVYVNYVACGDVCVFASRLAHVNNVWNADDDDDMYVCIYAHMHTHRLANVHDVCNVSDDMDMCVYVHLHTHRLVNADDGLAQLMIYANVYIRTHTYICMHTGLLMMLMGSRNDGREINFQVCLCVCLCV